MVRSIYQSDPPTKGKRAQPNPIRHTPRTANLPPGVHTVSIGEESFDENPVYQTRGRGNRDAVTLDPAVLKRLGTVARSEGRFDKPIKLARITNKTKRIKGCVLIDGFHRVEASRRAGLKSVEAEIVDMTRGEAEAAAVSANLAHGKGLTNAEIRAASRFLFGGTGWKDKNHKPRSLEDIRINELRATVNPRTFRRWVQQDCAGIYARYYADPSDDENGTKKSTRTQRRDYALEAQHIADKAQQLADDMLRDEDKRHTDECWMMVVEALEKAARRIEEAKDEFAPRQDDENQDEGILEL